MVWSTSRTASNLCASPTGAAASPSTVFGIERTASPANADIGPVVSAHASTATGND
jgi:hypothetical protein